MRKTNNGGFLSISIFVLVGFVLVIALIFIISDRSEIFKSSEVPYENPKVSDSTSSDNYMYQNDTYGIRIDPVYSEDFVVKRYEIVSRRDRKPFSYFDTMYIEPIGPRELDFAWASVEIGIIDSIGLDLDNSDEIRKTLLSDEFTYETSSIIDKWGSKVYVFESGSWTLYILDKGSNLFVVKIYLNNPDTEDEFTPIVEEVLSKIHFD